MRRSLIALSLAGGLLVSCRWAVTEVLVTVDTDAPLDRTLLVTASVVAESSDAGVFTVVRGGMVSNAVTFPGTFATQPAAGAPRDQRVTLVIDAELTSAGPSAPAVRWRRVHRYNFVQNQRTELRVFLSTRCGATVSGCAHTPAAQCTLSALCEERGLTCGDDAQCVSQSVTPTTMGNDAGATMDAAPTTSDAAQEDRAMDAVADSGACSANTQTDPLNCGACGAVCPNRANSTPRCVSGACSIQCVSGAGDCDRDASNGCESRLDTAMNCGTCGTACSNGTPVCSAGRCASGCTAPEQLCGGSCVNTQSNASHCGACGTSCPTVANASASCNAGVCQFACNAGFIDCNMLRGDGCETNLASDTNNCGACGRRCAAGAICRSGTCVTPPAGDSCATAVSFSSSMYAGTTCGGDVLLSSCGAPGAPDVFLNFTPPATGSWIISVSPPFSLSTHTGDCRTVHTCYGQTLNGFFLMGSSTVIGVRSNNATTCGPFTVTATM